ncbi:MAG TPA: exopolysaccharide biosynthesis protein [Methylophilaceae bacterium]|nr:exopolysaccharide biosynthesis protein [Methylophilaceae bacterium]
MSAYKELVRVLEGFAEMSRTRSLTLGEALDTLDEAAYGFIALIIALPFLQPVPLGPFTVVGGLAFATLGWQMWHGHESPVLPKKLRDFAMSEKSWRILVNVCLKIVSFGRKFTKPRYDFLVSDENGSKVGSLMLMTAGLLMAIPFGVLPFNNVLPALAIVFYCFGQLEEDGLMVLIGYFWLLVTIIYFGLFFFALWYFGSAAVVRWLT